MAGLSRKWKSELVDNAPFEDIPRGEIIYWAKGGMTGWVQITRERD